MQYGNNGTPSGLPKPDFTRPIADINLKGPSNPPRVPSQSGPANTVNMHVSERSDYSPQLGKTPDVAPETQLDDLPQNPIDAQRQDLNAFTEGSPDELGGISKFIGEALETVDGIIGDVTTGTKAIIDDPTIIGKAWDNAWNG